MFMLCLASLLGQQVALLYRSGIIIWPYAKNRHPFYLQHLFLFYFHLIDFQKRVLGLQIRCIMVIITTIRSSINDC